MLKQLTEIAFLLRPALILLLLSTYNLMMFVCFGCVWQPKEMNRKTKNANAYRMQYNFVFNIR